MTTGQLSKTLKGYARTTLNNNYTLPVISYLFISLVYSTVSYPFEIYFQRTVQLSLLSKEGSQVSLFSLVVYFAAMLFLAFLAMLLQVGLCKILLNLSRKDEFQFQLLFYAFSHHPDKYILVALYLMAMSFFAMLPCIVCFLCLFVFQARSLFPFFIFLTVTTALLGSIYIIRLSLGCSLTQYLLLDFPELSVTHALSESRRLMEGNIGTLFYLHCSFFGILFLSVLTFGISLLWTVPYITMTYIYFYRHLTREIQINVYDSYD